jgi:hypothetical protein
MLGTNLLIRRFPDRRPDPFGSVRDLGRVPVGCPERSGKSAIVHRCGSSRARCLAPQRPGPRRHLAPVLMRAGRSTVLSRPLPRTRLLPDLVTDGFCQARLCVCMNHAPLPGAVALRSQTGLTGSGSHRYSYGGFGGGYPPTCMLTTGAREGQRGEVESMSVSRCQQARASCHSGTLFVGCGAVPGRRGCLKPERACTLMAETLLDPSDHPKKDVREALQHIVAMGGWRIVEAGHWGDQGCCDIPVSGTPEVPSRHARDLERRARRCPLDAGDPRSKRRRPST